LKKAFRIPTPERAVISRDGTRAAFEVFYGYLGFFNRARADNARTFIVQYLIFSCDFVFKYDVKIRPAIGERNRISIPRIGIRAS